MYISKKIIISDHPLSKDKNSSLKLDKIQDKHFCLTRRDNNCFYTATIHCLLNEIYKINEEDFTLLKRRMQKYKPSFEKYNGSSLVFDDFFETFVCELDSRRINQSQTQKEQNDYSICIPEEFKNQNPYIFQTGDYNKFVDANLTGENQENYAHITAFIKLIVSTYIKDNQERFNPFIGDVYNYCRYNVDVMNKDAGEIEIIAFSEALDIELDIFEGAYGKWDKYNENGSIIIKLLFTPGHYEPIFDVNE